jgi:alkanesulfonate monooxygenase SsuD/methylene tetrahydromethanopterin reductase-like flavin-dependent oxidoreductase (luciferase family)
MEFGMFHEFPWSRGQTESEAFDLSFEQIDAAERWGLDVMWLAELHAAPTRSVLSAPLNVATAIATRTSRIKIGTAVQVLPLCHPLRIAEEAATVDQISHGRLIFGVGRSGFPRTYQAYGIPYAESQERFAETLDIIQRAWTEDSFSYDGRFYSFHNVHLVPKPFQKPFPELRIAVNSPDTFPAVGALGYPIFVAVRIGTLSELAPNIAAYRAAWRAAGHPGEGKVFLRLPLYTADTYERARDEAEDSIMHFYRWLGDQLEASASQAGARAIEQRAERGQRLQTMTYQDALRDKVVVGSPRQVSDRLRALHDELGLDGILAEINCGSLIAHEKVMRSLKLLCQEVMPAFR